MVPKAKKSVISEADIMMYLALGFKHARLMLLLLCLSMVSGLVYYTFARPVYRSRALIRYRPLSYPSMVDSQKLFRDARDAAVRKELASPHIQVRTAKRLGVEVTWNELQAKYLKQVRVTFNSEHNIEVEVYPYSYDWAVRWPETLLQEYLLNRDERRIEQIKTTFQAFTEDMADLQKRMDDLFNQKFDFSSSNEFTRMTIELNRYSEVPRQIRTVQAQLTIMDRTREALQNNSRDTIVKLSLLAGAEKDLQFVETKGNQSVIQLNIGETVPKEDTASGVVVIPSMVASTLTKPWEELDKEQRRLQQLAFETGRVYLSRHPKMMAIQKQLDDVNRALDLELAAEQNRFDLRYAHLEDKLRGFERQLPDYEGTRRRYEKYTKEYQHIDKGQLAWSRVYDEMSKKLSALDFGADNVRAQLEYGGLLQASEEPVAPNRYKLVFYFLLVGLGLAVAVPSLIEYLDNRVSDVDQVEETLHIRGLGIVPRVIEAPVDTLLLPDAGRRSVAHVMENFRLIRTNLILNSTTPALPQVILVTSSMPQEGKTIVAAHLAMSFAQKGEKTLLIDADLRRGRVHRIFGCENRPGLTEVLRGERPLEDAFRLVGHGSGNGEDHDPGDGKEKLTLITCGRHIHWASELLDSPAFSKTLDDLRQKYQRIIVDTPPVLGLSDTSIIQRLVDGVVLVIWSEFTPMRTVKTAVQTLQTNGAKFAGFVLNRLDFTALTNRYKYFYYSPYYYHRYKAIEAPASLTVK